MKGSVFIIYIKLAARDAAAAQNCSDVRMASGKVSGAGTVRRGGVHAGGWNTTDAVRMESGANKLRAVADCSDGVIRDEVARTGLLGEIEREVMKGGVAIGDAIDWIGDGERATVIAAVSEWVVMMGILDVARVTVCEGLGSFTTRVERDMRGKDGGGETILVGTAVDVGDMRTSVVRKTHKSG